MWLESFKKNKNCFRKKKTACVLFGRQKFSRVNNKMDLSLCRPFPRQSLRLFSKQIRACVAHVFHKHPPRVRFFHSIIPGHLFFLLHSITFVFFTAPTFIFFTASLFFSQHHPRAQPRLRRVIAKTHPFLRLFLNGSGLRHVCLPIGPQFCPIDVCRCHCQLFFGWQQPRHLKFTKNRGDC